MKAMTWGLMTAMIAVGIIGAAFAQERGTVNEAKVLADRAAVHVKQVGADKAFKDFNDKSGTKWHSKDLYVFAYNMKGDCLANGANEQLVGKNQLELRDPAGKLIIKEMIAEAAQGGGVVEYIWPHPQTKQVEGKTSYVVRIDGYDGFVGVGAYR